MGRTGYDTTNMKVAKNPRPAVSKKPEPEPKTGGNGDDLETSKQPQQQQQQQEQQQEQPQSEPLIPKEIKQERTFHRSWCMSATPSKAVVS